MAPEGTFCWIDIKHRRILPIRSFSAQRCSCSLSLQSYGKSRFREGIILTLVQIAVCWPVSFITSSWQTHLCWNVLTISHSFPIYSHQFRKAPQNLVRWWDRTHLGRFQKEAHFLVVFQDSGIKRHFIDFASKADNCPHACNRESSI